MVEKSLINIEKQNIFQKVYLFVKKIFYRESKHEIKGFEGNREKSNTIKKLEEENRILQLQKDYERGKVIEEELTQEEKEKLLTLYKNQIDNLKMNYKEKQNQFEFYKNKIIQLKN